MNEDRPGEIIELLGLQRDDLGIQRLEQQQMLLQAGRNPAAPQRIDERNEHATSYPFVTIEVEGRRG